MAKTRQTTSNGQDKATPKRAPKNRIEGVVDPPTGPAPELDIPPDPFDPETFKRDQAFDAGMGIHDLLTHIPTRKSPAPEWWFRTHPDPQYTAAFPFLELKSSSDLFLLAPQVAKAMATEPCLKIKGVTLAVNHDQEPFVLHYRIPGVDGRTDLWMNSMGVAIDTAKHTWVRCFPKSSYYHVQTSDMQRSEPTWPDLSLRDVMQMAFGENLIDDLNDPRLKILRGQSSK